MFKINIAEKGKTFKIESDSEALEGKKLGDKVSGKDISPDLSGYEFTIKGASDIAGFPHKEDIEGPQLKKVLLKKGWGMHKRTKKEGKKPVSTPKGFRRRKTVRGNTISDKTVQINLVVKKPGSKPLQEIFPDQNKKEEEKKEEPSTDNDNKQEKEEKMPDEKEEIKEEIKEEVKEEIKDDIPDSPETKTEEQKEKATEEVEEEVTEQSEEVAKKIAEDEEKKE